MARRTSIFAWVALLSLGWATARGADRPPAAGLEALETGAQPLPGLTDPGCGGQNPAPCPAPGEPPPPDRAAPTFKQAPSFALKDLEGKEVHFGGAPGMAPHLLIFWSIFCEPCREELPAIEKLTESYASRGLKILTVNLDGPTTLRAVRQYLKLGGLHFPVVLDEKVGKEFVAAGAYGVTGTPTLFLIDRDGTVRWSHAGRLSQEDFEQALEKVLAP